MSRLAIGAGALALLLGASGDARAFCPSYTASSTNNTHMCGVEAAPGTNPTTAEWHTIFDVVARGPASWGTAGPTVPDIGQGCGKPEANHMVPASFPCELLFGIAMQETGWRQFCVPDTPADQVGGAERTIIAFDCGYGIGQVTSGMHVGETPDFDRARVASDPTYNLATGTRILADKWRATQCVGDNQPKIVEDWYTATWAYNGLAFSNNPNNPNYDAGRGVWDLSTGGAAPYQEKVFGWIEHPPSGRWTPVALAYPDPGMLGMTGAPGAIDEPHCASPTDCKTTRSVHTTACGDAPPGPDGGLVGDDAGGSGIDGGTNGAGGATGGCGCRVGERGDSRNGDAIAFAALGALCLRLAATRIRRRTPETR